MAGEGSMTEMSAHRLSNNRFFFSSRRRHTRFDCDWSSDVCSSDLDWRAGELETDERHPLPPDVEAAERARVIRAGGHGRAGRHADLRHNHLAGDRPGGDDGCDDEDAGCAP